MEFAENLVLRMMKDPKERDRKFCEPVYAVKDQCKETKEMWSLPIRPDFRHSSVTILSLHGMLRLTKCLVVETLTMTSSHRALKAPSKSMKNRLLPKASCWILG